MVICPKCGSKKVFNIRIYWGYDYAIGDYAPANDRSQYTDKEWNMCAISKPEIDVFRCIRCNTIWE